MWTNITWSWTQGQCVCSKPPARSHQTPSENCKQHGVLLLLLPYSGKFSRGPIFADERLTVKIKPTK